MEIKVIYFLIAFSLVCWLFSLITMSIVHGYRNSLLETSLPGSPLATNKLEMLYLPPMVKMQDFVFFFDCMVVLWYLY